jgi:hypothetical protein
MMVQFGSAASARSLTPTRKLDKTLASFTGFGMTNYKISQTVSLPQISPSRTKAMPAITIPVLQLTHFFKELSWQELSWS